MVRIQVNLNDEQIKYLEEIDKVRKVGLSALVREIVEVHINRDLAGTDRRLDAIEIELEVNGIEIKKIESRLDVLEETTK